jgi:hypothetical protein
LPRASYLFAKVNLGVDVMSSLIPVTGSIVSNMFQNQLILVVLPMILTNIGTVAVSSLGSSFLHFLFQANDCISFKFSIKRVLPPAVDQKNEHDPVVVQEVARLIGPDSFAALKLVVEA